MDKQSFVEVRNRGSRHWLELIAVALRTGRRDVLWHWTGKALDVLAAAAAPAQVAHFLDRFELENRIIEVLARRARGWRARLSALLRRPSERKFELPFVRVGPGEEIKKAAEN